MGKSLIKALIIAAVLGALLSSWQVFVACWMVGWTMVWLTQSDDAADETSDDYVKTKRQKIVPQYVLLQRLERLEQELVQTQARLARLEGRQPETIVSHVDDLTSGVYTNSSHLKPPLRTEKGRDFRQPETVACDEFDVDLLVPDVAQSIFRQPENRVDISLPENIVMTSNAEELSTRAYTNSPHRNLPPQAGEGTGFRLPENEINEQAFDNNDTFRQPETLGKPESSSRKKVMLKRRPQAAEHADSGAAWEDNPLFAWFMRANPLLKIGALVLFLGLAFLLRYVGGAIPLVGRYALVFAAGAVAVGVGAKLRAHKREYGLTVQGFGFGVMYLTVLAAVKLHPLLPNGLAFVAMVVLVALMELNALRYDAKIMAQAAVLGGLAAPVLTSDGSGSYLILFTYLAVLNGGIAVLAWFKAWRSLNILGMVGTFFIAASWGNQEYAPHLFATTEPFLLYHWLLYTAIACFFARKTLQLEPLSGSLKRIPDNASLARIGRTFAAYGAHIGALDSSLLFGSALMSFGLQYAMVDTFAHGAAWSAVLWAVVYGALAVYFARFPLDFAVMKQAFAALALVFITLAIPLALEQKWTAMTWALEAALIYTFGLTQRQPQTRLLAMAIFVLAAVAHFDSLSWHYGVESLAWEYQTETALRGSVLGTFLAAASGALIYGAWATSRREGSAVWEKNAAAVVLFLALIHALTLPLLVFGRVGCMMAFAVYALAFAAAQWRQAQGLLSSFALMSMLLSILNGWGTSAEHFYVYCVLAVVAWLGAATLLHKAQWRHETESSFLSGFNELGGWLLLAVGLWFGHDTLSAHLSLYYSDLWRTGWLWSWLLWHGGLLLWAHFSGWRQGVHAATGLAILFALGATLWHTPMWAEFVPYQGFGFMFAINGLAALGLYWQPEKSAEKSAYPKWIIGSHAAILLLYVAMWTRFSGSLAELYAPAIAPLGWLCFPLIVWLILTRWHTRFAHEYRVAYWHIGSTAMALMVMWWLVYANFAAPPRSDLPYLPVLNVVELGSLAVLWQLYHWLKTWQPENTEQHTLHRLFSGSLPALFLLLLSGGVMRLWHVFGDVPWRLTSLLASFGVQASLSIVWALAAIALMVSGNRAHKRTRWLIGAGIMGVVVLKLFLVELGNSGGVARIVSFIVVGLLMLLVGWFAPAPPREE
ncbi:DUF2339 domain-containing protein [Neisseriaceae bacterium B1]